MLWTDEAHFNPYLKRKLQELQSLGGRKFSRCGMNAIRHIRDCVLWCGIVGTFILGPYLFEDATSNGMQTCFNTGVSYKARLKHYVIPELQQRNVINVLVWMQDGVPPHNSTSVRQLLKQYFVDRIISNFAVSWPLRYPDLTLIDFWFRRYLKSKMYTSNPLNLSELKVSYLFVTFHSLNLLHFTNNCT